MHVRQVGVIDWELVRDLRLHALVDAPETFGSTHAREIAFSREVWIDRLTTPTNATFVCGTDNEACGIVTLVRDANDTRLGWLVGMWTAPPSRGTGAADLLISAALKWAEAQRIAVVRLHVMNDNARAEGLYRRHGFNPTGGTLTRERDGKIEVEMERPISS
jgi:ribosomal protein S18 acetylase RimI-like enzyme